MTNGRGGSTSSVLLVGKEGFSAALILKRGSRDLLVAKTNPLRIEAIRPLVAASSAGQGSPEA